MSRKSATEKAESPDEHRFWELAQGLLEREQVTRSTMMGLPCLRVDGAFFATYDRKTGGLVVKLPEARVDELISSELAVPFAPAGRRFREWAAIPPARSRDWRRLMAEALAFVGGDR